MDDVTEGIDYEAPVEDVHLLRRANFVMSHGGDERDAGVQYVLALETRRCANALERIADALDGRVVGKLDLDSIGGQISAAVWQWDEAGRNARSRS